MLASTWLDIVIGIDLHFELVPPPMLPVPFPHPFVGLVLDPIGLAAGLAISNAIGMATGGSFKGPVLINLMPANTTGTEAKNFFLLPHFIIPPGAMWAPMFRVPKPAIIPGKAPSLELPIPPPGDAVMITGSKTVHAMGANLCRLGDIALSCSDPIRLPTSVVLTIPKGLPVLVGGPPAVDWMAAGFGLIKCKWIASRLHRLVNRIKNARLRNLLHKGVCFFTGHPVDVATGRVMTESTDFELPGPLPLVFERTYVSSWAHRDSPLGHGWSHPLDQAVWIEPGCVVYRAEDGREIEFDTFDMPDHAMRPGEEVFDPLNRLTLRSLGRFRWEIEAADGVVHELEPIPGDRDRTLARLVRKRTRNGHEITLHYDDRAQLSWVRDAGGRIARFEHDEAGRLSLVSLPHPTQPGWVPHTRYVYSGEGDLVEVIDPLGHATRYAYEGHLLVRETDRTGLSFYFGYDGNGPGAYCIRTWGDGGIYDHEIDYDKVGRVTYVTNSLDATTTYEMNVAYAVVKVIDACGGETRFEYDDNLWMTAEVDPLGNATRYEYDARGNRVRTSLPGGATIRVDHDKNNLPVRAVDPCDGEWRWDYDERGQLQRRVDPLGQQTLFEYRDGLLAAVTDPAGARASFSYDDAKNLRRVRSADSTEEGYEHDRRGRVVLRKDPRGNVQRRHHDACARLVTVEEPDGNVRRLGRDPEGYLVEAQDHHHRITLRYSGYHKLSERDEAGAVLRLRYDTEGQLVELENEAGEVHRLQYDPCGRLREERGFDGRTHRYERDRAGNLIKAVKPSGACTQFAYDPSGRLTKIQRSDGSEERFSYREDGELVEATSGAMAVRIERDRLGRVIREQQGAHWVESRYDARGARVGLASSLGASMTIERDRIGDAVQLTTGGEGRSWHVALGRDAAGSVVERRFAGGVAARWQRDRLGRPVTRTLARGSDEQAREELRWEPGDRLAAVVDAGLGPIVFERDARGRLASARHANGRLEHRAPDATGNLFRDASRADRTYGPGGEIRRAHGAQYIHDDDGHLIEKVRPGGARWKYAWNAAGQLREVTLPDGRTVTFSYDALGRRVKNRSGDMETTWVWDGQVPLHEHRSGEAPITWVFEPESFAPLGKIQGEARYGIITDPLGAPSVMFDEAGEVAWNLRLDVYGAPEDEVAGAMCPWRWPGQYEDPETGLYYNRFRYYDPELGRYISPDPIGLEGGLNTYAYVPDPTIASDPLGLTIVWHYTSAQGFQAIQSRAQGAWYFKASQPPGGRPFGVYFTSLFSPDMTAEHHRMGIPTEKRTHFFAVEVADDKIDDLFKPLPGGRGLSGVSIYVPNDIEVMRILQNDWYNRRNRSTRTVRQAGCGRV
ncbi:DUF6531 domain-containing protein [Sorangium sp. So ce1335]|uniref:DUF6531 domain-containing protein n=1 Tax=Sorangium sp. So ce1335 TaxID=3133335 RepID=UPI003F643AE1